MQSLVFFNKEGDNLNFKWKPGNQRFEGDLIFHENSNDTFKSISLYLFESIPSFEYEQPGILGLEKFQLFNEYRFNYTGNAYFTQSVTTIETVNSDPNFYSKWIYGQDFEKKFPVGTQIFFTQPVFEFTNDFQTYTVTQTKKNAILIITNVDNLTFNNLYGPQLGLTSSYVDVAISGLNSIGVYNYVNENLQDNLSAWSEPEFYRKYFVGKKVTVINTEKNDGVYTVDDIDIYDKIYFAYDLDLNSYTQSQNVAIELILKTDLPIVYTGALDLSGNTITFAGDVPTALKPGSEFELPFSILNPSPLVVDSIPQFLGNANLIYYATQSLVVWENNIYECVLAHTWSATSSITPASASFWSPTTYLPLTTQVVTESFLNTEVNLTTNKLYFTYNFTQSHVSTLASIAEKYRSDFAFFNVDLYYENLRLHADLIYPSRYAEINYFLFTQSQGNNYGTNSVGITRPIYEHNVKVREILIPEVNENTCENFSYNIVFTDIDEYGIKVRINGHEYEEPTDFIYTGTNINLPRTIDRTLRNWFITYYPRLISLGIIPRLEFVGSGTSIYLNTINLNTEYPNVPMQFEVRVGSTADFYIEHTEIIFFDMSNYLELIINGRSYGQNVTVTNGIPDIPTALADWIDNYQAILDDYGIFITNINQMLVFKIKRQNTRLEIDVRVGKASLPGVEFYRIVKKYRGSFGALMTSNEIILPDGATYSFEDELFATGQIVAINNSYYPYVNQEYNILYLGPHDIVLSYQGPFWGTTSPFCDVSPYITVAFSTGFGATGCLPVFGPTYSGSGQFNLLQFTHSFNLYNPTQNFYSLAEYELIGNSNLVDIVHLPITGNLYVLGDKVSVVNGTTAFLIQNITLPGLTAASSIMMKYNTYNNYLYCLSTSNIYVLDPVVGVVVHSITQSFVPYSLEINSTNGDVYVSYANSLAIRVWSESNYTTTPTAVINTTDYAYNFVYNDVENDMYVTQNDDYLVRIDGATRTIQNSYLFTGLYERIFYEPINSSLYLFDSVGMKNFNNGTSSVISNIGTASFSEVLYDYANGDVVISQNGIVYNIELDGTFDNSFLVANHGYLSVSPYDSMIYMAVQNGNNVLVMDANNSVVNFNANLAAPLGKIIYDPDRSSMFGIQPDLNRLIEIRVTLDIISTTGSQTFSIINEDLYGTLDPNYIPHPDIWLKTRDYIRKPRENYNDEPFVKYIWKWETDEYPQMFLYDYSGDLLPISGSYAYTGPKPLTTIALNKNQNKDLTKTSLPEYQKTIFDEIPTTLVHVDSETDVSFVPEPIQCNIGFRSEDEGYMSSTLLLLKRYDIDFTILPTSTNNNYIQFTFVRDPINGDYGLITLDINSTALFTKDANDLPRGLKPGQLFKVYISDITNNKNKYISKNHGKLFKIRSVFTRTLVVDFVDIILTESNRITDYPISSAITYMSVRFRSQDTEIGRFKVYGQTEIEDIRYKIELSNVGQNVGPDDVFIFKPYDINEQGVDWVYLNAKRKEMMMVRHDIFPYIGAYKSIVNAINFFGYNDLELYEYYRNINVDSPDFDKLFKVEIPDIFDNNVPGWTVNDFIAHTMPNPNFEDTNLFNLTYKITDKEGNNVLLYSLAEVIIKLQGLKYWLQRNIIPISHRILDITGRADWVGQTSIVHRNYDAKILNVRQTLTPFDFALNEAYLMPVNSGSTVYTCHIDFFTQRSEDVSAYFTVKIRTYKTYKEWNPFTTYSFGEKVIYYGNIYENKLATSKLKNPRKWDNTTEWSDTQDYTLGQFVKYDEYVYQYIGTQSSFQTFGTAATPTPLSDILTYGSLASWRDNTDWRKIDWEPVQYITEYRSATHSFNFTIDSNIDPFIVVEVTSYNGYGAYYTNKKNYEIRGLNDLFTGYRGDQILPFQPIIQINTPLITNPVPGG